MIASSNYVENNAPAIIINDESSSCNSIQNLPTLTQDDVDASNRNFSTTDSSSAEYLAAGEQINGNFLCLSDNVINLDDIPIEALRPKTKELLSKRLNAIKVILSENGSPRDWRGILSGIGLSDDLSVVEKSPDEMKAVLERWCETKKDKARIGTLQTILGYIDRWDVVDDTNDYFVEDAKIFLDAKKQKESRMVDTSIKQVEHKEYPKNYDYDYELLTHDDVVRHRQGLPPQRYDAYVLFDENDIDLATEILTQMETKYGFKLCTKERDLFGGTIESDTIMKMISDRCERLIVIFSNSFFEGVHNTFFVKFAQALGIEQRKRKIIPCVLEGVQLPPQLAIYYSLRYRFTPYYDFWKKLALSIQEIPESRIASSHAIMPRITITEIDSSPTVQMIDANRSQITINKNDLDIPNIPKRRDKSKSPKSSSPTTPTSLKKLWNNFPRIGSQSTISSSMWTIGVTDQNILDKENECCQSSLSLNNGMSSPTPTKFKKTKKWSLKKFLSPSSAYKVSAESDSSVGTDNSTKQKKWYRKRFRSKSREPQAAHES